MYDSKWQCWVQEAPERPDGPRERDGGAAESEGLMTGCDGRTPSVASDRRVQQGHFGDTDAGPQGPGTWASPWRARDELEEDPALRPLCPTALLKVLNPRLCPHGVFGRRPPRKGAEFC